jgi:ADP-ribose pyrophosphatase YjhB (NUDIX family)
VSVNARAIIWIDGLPIVAREAGDGRQPEFTLPGGHVNAHESIVDALEREVSEETGLEIDPGSLPYVSEVGEAARTRYVELFFLAEASRVPTLRGHFTTIDLDADSRPDVRPAILEQIASDARDGWRSTPRWLAQHPEMVGSNAVPAPWGSRRVVGVSLGRPDGAWCG